jgi:hypothetical protein
MRFSLSFAVWLTVVGASAAAAVAPEVHDRVGDQIVVSSPSATLRCRNDTTGTVRAGTLLVIKHVEGDWFWVVAPQAEGTAKGWIHRTDVVSCSQGIDALDEVLRRNPTAAAYLVRGKKWQARGDFDRALADCNQALCRDPSLTYAYDVRAVVWMKKGEFDRALADWTSALRLNSEDVEALDGRASALMAKAEIDIAAASRIKKAVPVSAVDAHADNSSSFVELVVDPSNALAKPAVVDRARPDGRLALRNVTFCQKIENYGRWEGFKQDEFKPGQPVLLYTEVENFCSQSQTDGAWHTVLKSTIEISDADGKLVQAMPFAPNEDLCQTMRRDYYNSYEFNIPEACAPGPHSLTLTVEDKLGHKTASRTIQFVVK